MIGHIILWGILFLIGIYGCVWAGKTLIYWYLWSKQERIAIVVLVAIILAYTCWTGLTLAFGH